MALTGEWIWIIFIHDYKHDSVVISTKNGADSDGDGKY